MSILKMHRTTEKAIYILLGFVSGVIACILVKKYTVLTFSNTVAFEVNPLELISLVVTIALAIYVTRTLTKVNDVEKDEKGLLVAYLADFKDSLFTKVSQILEQEDFDTAKTKSDLKVLRKKLSTLLGVAKEFEFFEPNESLATQLQ